MLVRRVLIVAGFGLAGAVSRIGFQMVYSRLQIYIFWAIALGMMIGAMVTGGERPSFRWMILNGLAATVAIVLVKWWLEGLPHVSDVPILVVAQLAG